MYRRGLFIRTRNTAVAAASSTVVFGASAPSYAAGLGQQLGVTSVADLFNLGSIPSLVLWLIAGCCLIAGLMAAVSKAKQGSHTTWGHVMIPFIVSAAAASGGILIGLGAQTIGGQAAGINAATAVTPLTWQ